MTTSAKPRSILIVAHGAPPSPLPGARRIGGLSRYLTELGHEVTVLSAVTFGRGPGEWGAHRVVRTRDVIASPLLERRRRWRKQASVGGDGAVPGNGEVAFGAKEIRTSRMSRFFVPDVTAATWVPFALPRAFELVRSRHYDCVITSAPPRSTHLIGLALQGRGLPWIADFRDGWNFEVARPQLARSAAWLDRRIEQLVAARADVATAVTPSLTADLISRLGARATTVTNGFDPAEVALSSSNDSNVFSSDRHSLLYTGSLRPPQFAPFASAFSALLHERPDLESQLELIFIGSRWKGVAELAAGHGLASIRWIAPLPREQVLRLQQRADSLLLLLEPERPGVVTTKLYEYIAANRPVLVVGPEGDAARVLADAGGGFCVPFSPEGLGSGLERLLAGERPPRAQGRDAYAYPQIAARMAEQVEIAIERRAERR